MKKIFTLMLAFACAMFVGVSCTPDNGDGTGNGGVTYDVTLTVETPAECAAAGGNVDLTYTLSKEVIGATVVAESSADWLQPTVAEEGYVLNLNVLPYNAAGVAPRSASLVVSYLDENNANLAEPFTVTVSQKSQDPVFAVAWSNQTPATATATISIKDPSLEGLVWGAFTFGQSALEHSDDFMPLSTRADAATMTPFEYATEQLSMLTTTDGYGFPGYYTAFYYMPNYGQPYFMSELNETVNCSAIGYAGWDVIVEDKAYLAVVGINKKDSDLKSGVDNSVLATVVHIFEVEKLPAPSVTLSASEVETEPAEGSLSVDVAVENPCEGVLSASVDWSVSWLTPTVEDNKLNIVCAENPYAVSRNAVVTVNYTYTVNVMQYGMEMVAMEINSTATVKVSQKANPNAENVTFKIEVTETHFDHMIVNVTPSNLGTTYVLGNVQQMGFEDAYKGDWFDFAVSQASSETYQGVQTGLRLDIEDYYKADDDDPASWKYWVYAYAVAEGNVAGEISMTLVQVTNDQPYIACPEGFTLNDGTFNLDVYGKGGDYVVKLNVENAPAEGYALKVYDSATWKRADEIVLKDEQLNHATAVFGNGQKISIKDGYLYFTVNDYPADWNESWDPHASFSLYLTNAENTKSLANYTVRVRLHPAQE